MMRRFPMLCAASLALAGCGGEPEEPAVDVVEATSAEQAEQADVAAASTDPLPGTSLEPEAGATEAAAESDAPLLQPLGESIDAARDLPPGCAFRHRGAVLFIAGAAERPRSRGRGVIQVDGADRLLTGEVPGGTAYVDRGPVMTDGEFTVEVVRAEGAGERVGTAQRRWAADLKVRRGMGSPRKYSPGQWTCGV